MASSVQIYESEQAARDAVSRLGEAGFRSQKAFIASELAGQEASAVDAAVEDGAVDAAYKAALVANLQQGRSAVVVTPAYGRALEAQNILASIEDPGSRALPELPYHDPAPLSNFFGWPCLSKYVPMTGLASSKTFIMGLFPLLGGGPAVLPFPTVMPKTTPERPPSKSNPAPLSSIFQLPLLASPKSDWNHSFGFQMLIRNPAPLSALFGMPVLSDS